MKNIIDYQYKELLQNILDNGTSRDDRTGTGTIGIFGAQLKVDVSESIPLITSKKVNINNIIHETLWMFSQGSCNITKLQEKGVKIWNQWAGEDGDLGPMYGTQARAFPAWKYITIKTEDSVEVSPVLFEIDQLQNIVASLTEDPYSRRHVMTLWNPVSVPDSKLSFQENIDNGNGALANCHGTVIQFYVEKDGYLSLHMYQRSADVFLGTPYNLINYTVLLYMMAQVTRLKPMNLTFSFGDVHIYKNHLEQVKELLSRPVIYDSPQLLLNPAVNNINDFIFEDFTLINYESYPFIKAPISV